MKEKVCGWLKGKYGYLIIIFLASIPLMNNYLIKMEEGHDLFFHLMRIEGIAEGLLSGQFPVKIQPGWYDGYGYGCSVFYGDIFLYLSAVLRIIGLPLQTAYKFYVFMCNVATAAIAGYSFKRIFKNEKVAVFGTALYTLSVYRLMNVYIRAAVGEHTAMIFLPLLAYAFICIVGEKKNLQKGWILLGLGMTGVLQSHIISAEIYAAILGLLCLVCIKRVWKKDVILAFVKAVVLTIGLNVGFLVPFVDYMINGQYNVSASSTWRMEQNIQDFGAFPSQLFGFFYKATGHNLPKSVGTAGEMPLGVGLILAVSLVVFVVCMFCLKKEEKQSIYWHLAKISAGFSVLTIWMSTCYFPWEFLRKSNILFRYMIINIQFPWRFCTIATLSLTMLWCALITIWFHAAGVQAEKGEKAVESGSVLRKVEVCVGMISALTVICAGYMTGDALLHGNKSCVHSKEDMNTRVPSGEEYLPLYTQSDLLEKDKIETSDAVTYKLMRRNGVHLDLQCANHSTERQLVSLPLLYYKGYQAKAIDESEGRMLLELGAGANNVVAFWLPPEFKGSVSIEFAEPCYWRIAEGISVLTLLGLIGWGLHCSSYPKPVDN